MRFKQESVVSYLRLRNFGLYKNTLVCSILYSRVWECSESGDSNYLYDFRKRSVNELTCLCRKVFCSGFRTGKGLQILGSEKRKFEELLFRVFLS